VRIFGVLNVTPDSFSDGGEHFAIEDAVAHGRHLIADGADWIDVGGESTAPGIAPVGSAEERRRILPVIRELVAEGIRVSVDTFRAETAAAAVGAGAEIVNDVFGADPAMPAVLLDSAAQYVMMHSFGAPTTPHAYGDVVEDVRLELLRRVDALEALGVDRERVILDPGLGFSKEPQENWTLLRRLDELVAAGLPVFIGTSRKRFVRALVGEDNHDRDTATAVTSVLAAQAGVWAVRVHDVRATRVALDTLGAWNGADA
jgi:dihydropteroate synthase